MPSFSDSIFLFVLALLLFGPKRLPVLARELGKWIGEFRRASNEFKMQMEDELRLSEQAERNKQIAAMEAAAPVAPPLPEPEYLSLPSVEADTSVAASEGTETDSAAADSTFEESYPPAGQPVEPLVSAAVIEPPRAYEMVDGVRRPRPIAVSGELKIMPPSTGLPAAREGTLNGLLNSIPPVAGANEAAIPQETTAHGI